MTGQIYFIECAGRLKVGFSNNVALRMIALQNAAPRKLNLLGSIAGDKAFERRIHEQLKEHREHGEWFKLNPDVRAFIRRLVLTGPAAAPEPPKPPRKTHVREQPKPYELPAWAKAIRGANVLLEQYEKMILAAPRERARAMFLVFAEAVSELETIIEGDLDETAAPAWLAAFEQRLTAAAAPRLS